MGEKYQKLAEHTKAVVSLAVDERPKDRCSLVIP